MKWLQNIFIGCLIGMSVSYIVVTISALLKENYSLTGQDLLQELLLALILGAVIGLATLLFDVERWPFPILLFIHFSIVVTSVFIAGAYGDWYDVNLLSMFLLFVEVVVIYIVVWGIMLVLEKREISTINKIIQRK